MYKLAEKVVIVTGASSGIGKALAEHLLAKGALVAICARNIDKLNAIAANNKDQILTFKADVSKEEDCKAFIEAVVAKWGRVDVLINNAGISMRALFEDVELKVIEELMAINFWGTVYCTKYALPYIKANNGVVAGVSSIAGYRGLPGRTGYSASKFAMQGFLEALRTELLYSGTHVMWVSPGFTSSNIRNVARSASGKSQKETPLNESKLMSAEECANRIIKGIEQRKRTIVMTSQGWWTVFVNKLIPGFVDKKVFDHFRNEPDSPLKSINVTN